MRPIRSPKWRCDVKDESTRDPDDLTVAPDHRPLDAQPQWRQDFPIDWPADSYVARRNFVKFLVLTSLAFVAGQAWIGVKSLLRRREVAPAPRKVASLSALANGSAVTFRFPGEDDPCLLIRDRDGELRAYSQSCTHLSCAVVPEIDKGCLRCPCHEGFFDLRTGRNISGPPPRPLPVVELEVRGDEVWAVGVAKRVV
jgi:Rieske Fe-S protein